MLQINRDKINYLFIAAALIVVALAAPSVASAQSSDANFPTPVFTNEVSGRIAPRDVGDPRRTSHFYTFRGTEGDLSVTFDSTELTGDVDVFTATTLRPLLKITLLGDAAHVTKSFYIRSEETLVLRVQARAVGDAEGTYRITFGGSFQPAPQELANTQQPAAPTVKESGSRDKNVRPTTSTGARIEEPAAPKEEAKTEATPTPTPAPSSTPARRTTSSASRGRAGARTAPRRTRQPASTAQPNAAKAETDETKNSTGGADKNDANSSGVNSSGQPPAATNGATNSNESSAATPKSAPANRRRPARTPRRGAGESGSTSARTESGAQPSNANPPAATEPLPKQRLLIITKSGSMIERDMDTVRRVTVENNQVVVVTKDGKIIREPLANVLRMSIEP